MTRARTHTRSSTRTGQGPSAGTNHLLKLLWRSWQSARGRHDFGSHSCPHQQSKMFLGVDPWQPLLLQSSFITVKFYKRENKPFFLHFNRLSIQLNQSKQLLREFICFWRHVLNREGTKRPTVILSLQGHNLPETVTYNGKMQPSNTWEPRNNTWKTLNRQCLERYWEKKKSFPTNTKKKQKQKKTQKELEMYQCLLANLH